ncbi:outer dense fiber protein 2-like isoform X3 [Pomacea canaliculata]|uniref:outer dense fiber protein 2-like isoform X3 n=1 Tax=Pomacea canaliculata TaxID=400727 RepID=UPI000D729E6B|nr:outer dense fiber protein 2-like isoform X3 [Pomacea canaliculata]
MTLEKGLRPTNPIHVHVDETTPVHLHMKRTKRTKSGVPAGGITASNRRPRSTRRATTSATTARARSCSPRAGPWVPAPGKATRGARVTWQVLHPPPFTDQHVKSRTLRETHSKPKSPTRRVEMEQPHGSDPSTDEEEVVQGKERQYEERIHNLMNQVGTLKNEVDLQMALRELDAHGNLLDTSQRTIERQEATLHSMEQELQSCEQENFLLRKSVDITKTEKELLNREREQLMKKLIEVEMDGQAAQQHVRELRDVIRRLRDDNRLGMSSSDAVRLNKLKEAFFEKMADFEATNRALRRLLREHHRSESEATRLVDQRDLLLRKVADGETSLERLRRELIDKERLVEELQGQVMAQREETLALSKLQEALETTRAHLQKQLRTKEADCNRMAVQIRTLEGQLSQCKIEMDHLQEFVSSAKHRGDADKEALKKATRAQKLRAEQCETKAEKLAVQVIEGERSVHDLSEKLRHAHATIEHHVQTQRGLESQLSVMQKRADELEMMVNRMEEKAKLQVENLTECLHEKTTEVTALRLECERMKSSEDMMRSKMTATEEQVLQLRSSISQYEHLVQEYRGQIDQSRRDVDQTHVRMEEKQREATRLQRDNEVELEKVKLRLHQRLQELEPLPELLRTTELRLHEASEKLLQYERRNTENTRLIAELTAKVENRGEAVGSLQERIHESQEESRVLQARLEVIERRVKELEDSNRELTAQVARKEEALHQLHLQLEEKSREGAVLTRQLENTLTDLRQQQDNARDRFSSKERTYQSRVVDLESQLSQSRAEIARIKREKEESERKFNSRLYDLKDRLEQCHSTNRSMQNYVQFLKNSYANVFGETSTFGNSSYKPPIP